MKNSNKNQSIKKSLLTLVLITPLLASLTGCVIAVGGEDGDHDYSFNKDHDRAKKNRQLMADLQLNTKISTIKNQFGIPDFNEVYQKNDEAIQVLYYRTQRLHSDGMTTKDECSPLIFKNGQLVSWGEQALTQL